MNDNPLPGNQPDGPRANEPPPQATAASTALPPPADPGARTVQTRLDGLAPEYQRLTGFLSILLFIGAAIAAVVGLALPINQAAQQSAEIEVVLPKKAMKQFLEIYEAPKDFPGSLSAVDGGTTVLLKVHDVPRYEAFLSEAGTAVPLWSVAGICFLLAQMLRDIRDRRPFTKTNQGRVYGIAALLAVAIYAAPIVNLFADSILFSGHFEEALSSGYVQQVTPFLNLSWLVAIGVVVVFGEVFRQGRLLTQATDR